MLCTSHTPGLRVEQYMKNFKTSNLRHRSPASRSGLPRRPAQCCPAPLCQVRSGKIVLQEIHFIWSRTSLYIFVVSFYFLNSPHFSTNTYKHVKTNNCDTIKTEKIWKIYITVYNYILFIHFQSYMMYDWMCMNKI